MTGGKFVLVDDGSFATPCPRCGSGFVLILENSEFPNSYSCDNPTCDIFDEDTLTYIETHLDERSYHSQPFTDAWWEEFDDE